MALREGRRDGGGQRGHRGTQPDAGVSQHSSGKLFTLRARAGGKLDRSERQGAGGRGAQSVLFGAKTTQGKALRD